MMLLLRRKRRIIRCKKIKLNRISAKIILSLIKKEKPEFILNSGFSLNRKDFYSLILTNTQPLYWVSVS